MSTDRAEKILTPDVSATKTPDITVVGNGDMWQLLCKSSSAKDGWQKSTKAMQVPGGCVVQVTTRQKSGGGWTIAEALTYVSGVQIVKDPDHEGGRKLVAL